MQIVIYFSLAGLMIFGELESVQYSHHSRSLSNARSFYDSYCSVCSILRGISSPFIEIPSMPRHSCHTSHAWSLAMNQRGASQKHPGKHCHQSSSFSSSSSSPSSTIFLLLRDFIDSMVKSASALRADEVENKQMMCFSRWKAWCTPMHVINSHSPCA